MAGTWETQDKVLPGAYINIRTNEPLSITPGDRGIAVILQEMSVGEDGQIYTLQQDLKTKYAHGPICNFS